MRVGEQRVGEEHERDDRRPELGHRDEAAAVERVGHRPADSASTRIGTNSATPSSPTASDECVIWNVWNGTATNVSSEPASDTVWPPTSSR